MTMKTNLTTAFTIFVKQAIREQGIPFEITREIPNSETISAINEVQQMKKNPSLGKAYTDVEIFLTVDACDGYTETDMFIEWTNHFACVSLVLMVVKICIVHI